MTAKLHFLRTTFFATILALFTASALAQVPMMGAQVPLTPEIVGNFIESHPVIQERLDTFSDDYAAPEGDSPADAVAAYMTYQAASGELDALVGQYGFSSFMDWVQTMSSVLTAYTFVREGGGMDQGFQDAIDQINSNPNFTEEQRQAMIAQMSAAMQSVDAMRPDQANLDAVEPFNAELAELFEDD